MRPADPARTASGLMMANVRSTDISERSYIGRFAMGYLLSGYLETVQITR
jgi:hypothetical protein